MNIAEDKIAGVPVRIVTPLTIPPDKQNRVLINLHGGGFNADWGSEIESIPVANLTQTKVVAVLYSLAPEHPFPAALNESVAVYKELLKTAPGRVDLRHLGWRNSHARSPRVCGNSTTVPAASTSPAAETSANSATRVQCTHSGLSRSQRQANPAARPEPPLNDRCCRPSTLTKGFPPTLFLTSGRDLFSVTPSTCTRVRAGVNAQLV